MLGLIRSFLTAGIMIGGLVSPTEEGTPQGGPLSPLLSNIVLDELDKELERRGLSASGGSATPTTSSSTSEASGQGNE